MKVLVAVDFSAETEETLAAVRRCCASDALSVVVLHVAGAVADRGRSRS